MQLVEVNLLACKPIMCKTVTNHGPLKSCIYFLYFSQQISLNEYYSNFNILMSFNCSLMKDNLIWNILTVIVSNSGNLAIQVQHRLSIQKIRKYICNIGPRKYPPIFSFIILKLSAPKPSLNGLSIRRIQKNLCQRLHKIENSFWNLWVTC